MTTFDEAVTTSGREAHATHSNGRGQEEEARAILLLIERMVMRFPEIPARLVEDVVSAAHGSFAGARVRNYIPLLVEHDVLIELRVLARTSSSPEGLQRGPDGPRP